MPPVPRIAKPPLQHRRKPNLRLRPKHREWVKTLPCIACGCGPCDPAHVRMGTDGGAGLKPSDRFVVPLCRLCHETQHEGEVSFWAGFGIDPVDAANRLWTVTGDTEAGLRVIFRARQSIALHRREP